MTEALMIIPSYLRTNGDAKVLFKCIGTLRETTENPILVVDDASPVKEKDKFYKELADWVENVEVITQAENGGFSKTVNVGLKQALERNIDACLVNADIEFNEKEWLEKTQATAGDIIGARLLYPNMLIQHAGIYWSRFQRTFDHRFKGSPPNLPRALVPIECPVTGALQYIKHEVLEKIGLYDEEFPLGYEDVDYCIRAIQEGMRSVYNPEIVAIHHESLFRRAGGEEVKDKERESYGYFIKKYSDTNFSGILPGEVV